MTSITRLQNKREQLIAAIEKYPKTKNENSMRIAAIDREIERQYKAIESA